MWRGHGPSAVICLSVCSQADLSPALAEAATWRWLRKHGGWGWGTARLALGMSDSESGTRPACGSQPPGQWPQGPGPRREGSGRGCGAGLLAHGWSGPSERCSPASASAPRPAGLAAGPPGGRKAKRERAVEGLEAAPTLPTLLLWLLSDQHVNQLDHIYESQDQALQCLGEGPLGIRIQ